MENSTFKRQRRGAFTLHNKNAKNFIKKVTEDNLVNDPTATGRMSPNISNTGSEPRTPNVTPKKKKGVRFTNNTKKNNQNTRGLVRNITLESAPYLNPNIPYENLSPNNQYARNLSNARLSIKKQSRHGRGKLPPELAIYYAHLIHYLKNSSQTIKNAKNIIRRDTRLTPNQQKMLIQRVTFNFGK